MIKIPLVLLVITGLALGSCSPEIIELTFEDPDVNLQPDEQTLQSIRKFDGLYIVNYCGEYDERIQWLHDFHSRESSKIGRQMRCSLFAAYTADGKTLLGRNFDRDREIPVLGRFSAPGKYASFAFSPASEVNLDAVLGDTDPSEEQRNEFLYCLPFYATDGINEKGLAIAIAGAPPRKVIRSPGSDHMFVLYFIRQVLDNCKSVEEVAHFAETVSLYDSDYNTISHHFMVTDAHGKWLIIDYPEGGLRLTRGKDQPQIRTNHFLEGGPAIEGTSFARYDRLYRTLHSEDLLGSDQEAMELLDQVKNATRWSVVYESGESSGVFAVHGKFRTQYRFRLHEDKP